MRVECTCETCGNVFAETARRVALGYGRYCSWACRWPLRPGVFREDGVVMVPLYSGEFALIDHDDAEVVLRHNWHRNRRGYAATILRSESGKKPCKMHIMIMGYPPSPDLTVDHANRDVLDNRRSNLRWATATEQLANTKRLGTASGYKGVLRHHFKWRAVINVNKKRLHLGLFATPEDAARAYDAAAIEAWGDFAHTNFPVKGLE